jgi:hypothetical protein
MMVCPSCALKEPGTEDLAVDDTFLLITAKRARTILDCPERTWFRSVRHLLTPVPWGKRGWRYRYRDVVELAERGFYG